MERYEDWSEGRLEDLLEDRSDDEVRIACPECGGALEVMRVSEHVDQDSGEEVVAHCPACLRDWTWIQGKDGTAHGMTRFFHG